MRPYVLAFVSILVLSETFPKKESLSLMAQQSFYASAKFYVEYKKYDKKSKSSFELAKFNNFGDIFTLLISDTVADIADRKRELKIWRVEPEQVDSIKYHLELMEQPYIGTKDTSLYTYDQLFLHDSLSIIFEVMNKIDLYYDVRMGMKLGRNSAAYVPTVTRFCLVVKGRKHWLPYKDMKRIFLR